MLNTPKVFTLSTKICNKRGFLVTFATSAMSKRAADSDMKEYFEGESVVPIKFFHICTDGTRNGIVHFCDADYRQAILISAISAYRHNVRMTAFCHMSTHSHFVIYCNSFEDAKSFADEFKKEYARFAARAHGERKIYKDIDCTPKQISDPFYLRNCISYTLMNPVVPQIVKRPEDYRWSSFEAYFNNAQYDTVKVSSLGKRKCRELLHTREDLSSSDLLIDPDGNLNLKSTVDYGFVERLFISRTDFFRSLAITDCIKEEERYVRAVLNYSDTEILAEILSYASKHFKKNSIQDLTKDEKLKILMPILKKTRANAKRISRLLRLEVTQTASLLNLIPSNK